MGWYQRRVHGDCSSRRAVVYCPAMMSEFDQFVSEGSWRRGIKMEVTRTEHEEMCGRGLKNCVYGSVIQTTEEVKMAPKLMKSHQSIIEVYQNLISVSKKLEESLPYAPPQCYDTKQHTVKESLPNHISVEHQKQSEKISSSKILEIVQSKEGNWNRQLYILNPDLELTNTIKMTFEKHGFSVEVGDVDWTRVYMYVLLDRKVNNKRLRRLMERGEKFGLEFYLTRTGLTASLLA